MNIIENYSVKKENTFGIDSTALYYVELFTYTDIMELLATEQFQGMPKIVLGGGSNVLFTQPFKGVILKNNLKGINIEKEDDEHVYIQVGAGENWHHFVLYCIDHGYAGIENLSLIPGNIGAAPMQNIGAYGVEIKDVFHELEAMDLESLIPRTFSNEECKFGYRDSIFKNEAKGKYIITSVTFRLNKKPKFNTSYGAIEEELKKMGVKEMNIKAISEAVCNIRMSKLPNPDEIGNAGSFFKNPIVSNSKFNEIKKNFPELVAYKNSDNDMKLAAGWLIEQCGWKGQRVGDAGVHKNQALVLVNYGDAKGKDVLELSDKIMNSVKGKFGVELEREVNIY